MGPAKEPKADLIFPPQDDGPNRKKHVVKSHCDHCREFAAPEDPRSENGAERFETGKRSESPEDPDSHTSRNGMRGVSKLAEMCPRFLQQSLGIQLQFHEQ